MKRVALLISGRAARYDVCLLPSLERAKQHYDVFMSLNDEDCFYYEHMRNRLAKWLRGVYIQPYVIPNNFSCAFIENDHRFAYQKIDGRWLPRNVLSHFFNDTNAFKMATEYSAANGFEYDVIMKYRADIIADLDAPNLAIDPTILYSVTPNCLFVTYGKHKVNTILQDWHWGSPAVMKLASSTYDYILRENANDNTYIFHYESNFVDNLVDKSVINTYVAIPYAVDMNRRLFDSSWNPTNVIDSRKVNCKGAQPYIDIKSITRVEDLPVIKVLPGN